MLSNKLGLYKVDFFKQNINYTFRIHCFYCLYAPRNEMLLLFSPDGSTYNFQAFSSYHNTNNWYGKYYQSINTSTAPQLLHKNNTIFPFHYCNRNHDNFWYSKIYAYLVTFCCPKQMKLSNLRLFGCFTFLNKNLILTKLCKYQNAYTVQYKMYP